MDGLSKLNSVDDEVDVVLGEFGTGRLESHRQDERLRE